MANEYTLAGYKKSLSDLNEEELRTLMLNIRSNRRTVKAKAVELSVKGKKDGTNTKASTKEAIRGLSAEQAQQLLLQLNQGA